MSSVTSATTLWDALRRSRLLTPDMLTQARDWLKAGTSPPEVLERLAQCHAITPWQSDELAAGRHRFFLGHYKLLDRLATGGRGLIYKAIQESVGRPVVLKVLAREYTSHPDAVARFRQEVRAVARLDHPNIVRAYDACTEGRLLYLVLEYVPGQDLSHWLYAEGALPIDWTCRVGCQVADALEHAHQAGLVHRDVKPGNVMVVADTTRDMPHVKLLDLGFVRWLDATNAANRITQVGQVFGTPDYMSPEQIENTADTDARSDIYSLGCTLFRALTNRSPFPGENSVQKLLARLDDPPPRLRQIRPEAPAELEEVLLRMMAPRPQDRYATAREAAAALEPFAMGSIDDVLGVPPGETESDEESVLDTKLDWPAPGMETISVPHPSLANLQNGQSDVSTMDGRSPVPATGSEVTDAQFSPNDAGDALVAATTVVRREGSGMTVSRRSPGRLAGGLLLGALLGAAVGGGLGGLASWGLAALGTFMPAWAISDCAVLGAVLGGVFLARLVEPDGTTG